MSTRRTAEAQQTRKGASVAPRKRGPVVTRRALLEAAQLLFGTHGYAAVGLRQIASLAGVDAALVNRYFGSKLELFGACLEPHLAFAPWFVGTREDFATRVVEHLFSKPNGEPDALMMLLLAAGDEEAGPVANQLLRTGFLEPLAQWLGGRDSAPRAAAVVSLLSGAWMHRRGLSLTAWEGKAPWLRRWLAHTINELVVYAADPELGS